jgi:hypothetical protein
MNIVFPEPGLYMLEVSLQTECGVLRGELNVAVTDAIEPNLGPDMNVCVGEPVILSPGSGYASYVWNNESTEESITVSLPGTYTVDVANAQGCTYTDEVVIGEIIAGTIDLGPDFDFCDTVVVLNAGNNFLNYVWQDGTTGPFYTVFEPGTYSVTSTLPCEAFDEVVVVDCTIGVQEWQDIPVSVYPNPTEDFIYIDFGDESNIRSDCFLYDVTGRLVRQQGVKSALTKVYLGDLSSGIYTLKISLNGSVWNSQVYVR